MTLPTPIIKGDRVALGLSGIRNIGSVDKLKQQITTNDQIGGGTPYQDIPSGLNILYDQLRKIDPTSPQYQQAQPALGRGKAQEGTPYGYGQMQPGRALDCSGFVKLAYQELCPDMPRTSQAQYEYAKQRGAEIDIPDIKPGDLMLFKSSQSASGSHIGMYAGNNRFIHSPHTGARVRVEPVTQKRWGALKGVARPRPDIYGTGI